MEPGLVALCVLLLLVGVVLLSWRMQRRWVEQCMTPLGDPGSCPACREGCSVHGGLCHKCWTKQHNDRYVAAEREWAAQQADLTDEQRATYLEHFERSVRSRER